MKPKKEPYEYLKEAGNAAGRASTLCTEIKKGLGEIRENFSGIQMKLSVYMERRRCRHIQFMNERDWDLLMIIVLGMIAITLLGSYLPAWLNGYAWIVLLGGTLYCVLRRLFRKAL